MTVMSIGEYHATPRDLLANFHGMQLLYVYWEKHLMYCAPFTFPVPPSMPFEAFIEQVFKDAIKDHPDAVKVNFAEATWQLNGERFVPDYSATLHANGIDHKSFLRLNTPGLFGLQGSCN